MQDWWDFSNKRRWRYMSNLFDLRHRIQSPTVYVVEQIIAGYTTEPTNAARNAGFWQTWVKIRLPESGCSILKTSWSLHQQMFFLGCLVIFPFLLAIPSIFLLDSPAFAGSIRKSCWFASWCMLKSAFFHISGLFEYKFQQFWRVWSQFSPAILIPFLHFVQCSPATLDGWTRKTAGCKDAAAHRRRREENSHFSQGKVRWFHRYPLNKWLNIME